MENINKDDVFLGLAQTISLSSKYIDLATEVETYTQLRVLLKQQFEQAKIKQSKNFSPLYVIDSARPAEYKFKPKRAVVILAIVFVYMSLFITSLLLWNHYNTLRKNRPDKLEKIDLLLQQIFPKKK